MFGKFNKLKGVKIYGWECSWFSIGVGGSTLAFAMGAAGSSIGIGYAGRAASGVVTEDPDKFGRLIPVVALPGTQGFYGFLVFFLVSIVKMNLLGDIHYPSVQQGIKILLVGFCVGISLLLSGIHQGKVSAACVGIVAKKPEQTGKALILPAFVETYAVLGLVVGVLILLFMKY